MGNAVRGAVRPVPTKATGFVTISIAERFWAKVDRIPFHTCWEWTGALNNAGYGQFASAGKLRLAHRIAYELSVGPISGGLVLDHLCRNRACVRPDHLEAVTFRENLLRGTSPAAQNAQKSSCPRGHPLDGIAGGSHRRCLTCHRDGEARRRLRRGVQPLDQTRCRNGHARTASSTYHWRGRQYCLICKHKQYGERLRRLA